MKRSAYIGLFIELLFVELLLLLFSVSGNKLFCGILAEESICTCIYIYTPKVILLLCKLVSSSQDWLIISYSIKFGESYIAVFFFFGPLGRQFILGIQFGSYSDETLRDIQSLIEQMDIWLMNL